MMGKRLVAYGVVVVFVALLVGAASRTR